MSALTRLLYPIAAPRSSAAIVGWWERRRVPFNAIVGATGVMTLAVVALFSVLPPAAHIFIPWQAVVMYAVMANICYSFGWIIECGINGLWHQEVKPIGPLLFRQGLSFAVGLTLLPMVIAAASWAFRLILRLL